MCFAACICCRYTMPSEFVTLSIVITMEHFYLVREISMGNRCCTQPRCTILSFVIDISQRPRYVPMYTYTHTHTHTHTHIITSVLCLSSPLIIISPSPFRARTCLLSFILYHYYFTFALGASDRDLCRSVNSVGGRASMSSFSCLSLRRDAPPQSQCITLFVLFLYIILYTIIHIMYHSET
jgi:hypothetical protein